MSYSNYDDVVSQLTGFGLILENGLGVGTPRAQRCRVRDGGKERRGWYWLHEIPAHQGGTLIVGSYGMWQGNENNSQKVELGKATQISGEQQAALRKRLAEDRKRMEVERAREAARAAEMARKVWPRLEADGESPYLKAKGVGAHGAKFTRNGSAVIQLVNTAGVIQGLQFLRTAAQAKEARRPAKEFWPGGLVKKAHFHQMGAVDWIVLVAEGYATAASLYEATGLPVVCAFDAGNLVPVAEALRKRYRKAKILICADDDAFGNCQHREDGNRCNARVVLADHPTNCPECAHPHKCINTGVNEASAAALAVGGAWVAPAFSDLAARNHEFTEHGRKKSDFNDLHATEGMPQVAAQVRTRLTDLKWERPNSRAASSSTSGDGGGKLRPLQSLDEMLGRFSTVYHSNGGVFDRTEHALVAEQDVRRLSIRTDLFKAWNEHADRDIVRLEEVGFDPAGTDARITCNLWGGWPTQPKAGKCDLLLELLHHMCSGERNSAALSEWLLRWIAYPIQHPGAKMKSTIVVHGPQGTGKNMFFEAVMDIYGKYGSILDQAALEDKHNDCFSRRLFLIADEVIAQSNRFDVKNKLKTLVTGTKVRINPKHLAAYDEANHVNLVFLSNESMPVVLEEDDRRHCVIWTPPKKPAEFYAALQAEIEAGGVAALHDYLLHLDLGDFHHSTWPPDTEAKQDLIGLALDSPVDFVDALVRGDIEHLRPAPGQSTEWFNLYKSWCTLVGVKPASMKRFVDILRRRRGVFSEKKRYMSGQSVRQQMMITFGHQPPEGVTEQEWLGEQLIKFSEMVREYRGGMH
ncbi:DUF5906 domain-containing protein [Luteimonas sp. MJ293]|uniref:DUF5906 domain-containing protein n=1 Tax=Luteimonas sp. MJ146 TaxID=3129240 RepID=UPI0031B9F8ED